MKANPFDLISALPPELENGIVLAVLVLMLGGMGVGLVEFTKRNGLLSPSATRYSTLVVLGATAIFTIVLVAGVVLRYLRDVF